jgi:hypothetical protein
MSVPMSEITKHKLAVIWSKPKERAEYSVYARSREDAEAIVRLQFADSHTKDCEIVCIKEPGEQ